MGLIRNFCNNFRHPLQMFSIYVGAAALDFISSLKIHGGADQESNPFSRHADGSFWPWHALINNGLNTLEYLIISLIVFAAFRRVNRQLAIFVAGWPWIYYAYGHIDAAFFNIQALWWPHLYVETVSDVLKHMLGGS